MEAMANQKNAQTSFNRNIMADGVIYQQLQLPYNSSNVQSVFNQTLKLLQTYEANLSNIDVSNLSQHID